MIKQKVKERYGKIAVVGSSSEGCCAPGEYCGSSNGSSDVGQTVMSPLQIAENIGYNANDLNSTYIHHHQQGGKVRMLHLELSLKR